MTKRRELTYFNTAFDQEQPFDVRGPTAKRAWIEGSGLMRLSNFLVAQRILGKANALIADLSSKKVMSDSSQQVSHGNPMKFHISRFHSVLDLEPRFETVSWKSLVDLLSEPFQSPCTKQNCLGRGCPYKRAVGCWSPALFATSADRTLQLRKAVEVSLLVFDVDRLPDGLLDDIRQQLSDLQYLLHSTHSDTPHDRGLRFVIPLSRPVPAASWRAFCLAALQRLVPAADPACIDAERLYFLPSCPRNSSYFVQVNEGTVLDVDTPQ